MSSSRLTKAHKCCDTGRVVQHKHVSLHVQTGNSKESVSVPLNGLAPAQFAALLTAENAMEVSRAIHNPNANEAKKNLAAAAETLMQAENSLHIAVSASTAAAIIQAGHLHTRRF